MNLLVTAHGVLHRGPGPGKRGRVKYNGVKFRDDLFVRLNRCLRFKPVEYIDSFKGTSFGQSIGLRVAARRGYRFFALFQAMHMRRAGSRAVQRKATDETEAIQNLPASNKAGHLLVILLLIQIEARFVAAEDINAELESIEINLHRAIRGAA